MINRNQMQEIVISEIRKYTPELQIITDEMGIEKDLKLSGDDGGFLILTLQKKTGVKPPIKAWKAVETVGDIIDLLMKYKS